MRPYNLSGVMLYCGDCLEAMREMLEASVDAVVTDPPYGLQFMGKEWDKLWRNQTDADRTYVERTKVESDGLTARRRNLPDLRSTGREMQVWHEQWAREALRVAKPGAHLLAFGAARTHHRMMVAIEDAGWEIRDCLMWLYASGFPKSLDVGKAMDKAAGVGREVIAPNRWAGRDPNGKKPHTSVFTDDNWQGRPDTERGETAPATDLARQWDGWGTSLKPSVEFIVLARKPLIGTVAANVARFGTGALNIDGCRIGAGGEELERRPALVGDTAAPFGRGLAMGGRGNPAGRWPANLVLDEEAARLLDEQSGISGEKPRTLWRSGKRRMDGWGLDAESTGAVYGGTGGASRFFFVAKAAASERRTYHDADEVAPSCHPTQKPLDLMRWLVRLVTPPVVLSCETCYNSGHEQLQDVSGMRQAVQANAGAAGDLLGEVSEQDSGAGRADSDGTSLSDVREAVPSEGCAGGVLLDPLPGGGAEEAAVDVRVVQGFIPQGDEESEAATLLLPDMRRAGTEDPGREAVRGMQPPLPAEERRGQAVLFPDMRGSVERQGEAENPSHHAPRLHHALSAGAPDGDQGGLSDGASPRHGGTPGAKSQPGRSGASSERQQGRQSNRKPRSDAESAARPHPETDAEAYHLPPLRRVDSGFGSCPKCGSPLVERPGLVLDPFAGSGTTLEAARLEGFRAVGIEREAEYVDIIRRRLAQGVLPLPGLAPIDERRG